MVFVGALESSDKLSPRSGTRKKNKMFSTILVDRSFLAIDVFTIETILFLGDICHISREGKEMETISCINLLKSKRYSSTHTLEKESTIDKFWFLS